MRSTKPSTDQKPCPNCQHLQELVKALEARAESHAHELNTANLALRLMQIDDAPRRRA